MSTVELETDRAGAERLVRTALERTEGIRGYSAEGDTFVVEFAGFGSTFGQRMAVRFDEGTPERTTLEVTAARTSPFAFTANPWKHKAAFLEQLRAVRSDPAAVSDAEERRATAADGIVGVEDGPTTADAEPMSESVPSAELETLRAVKLLLAVLLVVVGAVLVTAWLL